MVVIVEIIGNACVTREVTMKEIRFGVTREIKGKKLDYNMTTRHLLGFNSFNLFIYLLLYYYYILYKLKKIIFV